MTTLDFGKLNAGVVAKHADPRKIFTTLKREARFKRPLDEQSDVLDAWYARRATKDLTIKMNTGGGKTVVGLLCLQSSLHEGVRPAIYITPDNFLSAQVIDEAKALGIAVTTSEKDPDFTAGRAILVANVHKLFNARSVFGIGSKKIPIGAVIIDDAHACLSVVSEQFRIVAAEDGPVYKGLLALFDAELNQQSSTKLLDIKAKDATTVMQVPFWAWHAKYEQAIKLLHEHRLSAELEWHWPLLSDCIRQCYCAFGGGKLEIAPRFIPVDRIPAFAEATRRIYMTATLADDSILVSHFNAAPADVAEPIRPKGGGDIGDRMILAPQEINPAVTLDEIKALLAAIAVSRNVFVIVPSNTRASYWADIAVKILTADNVHEGIEAAKNGHVGLTVLVNKYDGIDLPGSACEVLVIDGLPETYGIWDRLEMERLDGTKRQLLRQMQRVEQGMGRGVRSSDDHCVVLLLGSKLTQKMHEPEADQLFSAATRAQIELGRNVALQVRGQPLSALMPILDLCLEQNDEWVATGRSAVVNAPPDVGGRVDENIVRLREAFDAARIDQYDIAISKVQQAVSATSEKRLKGYLKQVLAEYTNVRDPAAAQELQLAALDLNPRLLKPLQGITYRKLNAPADGQALTAKSFMQRFLEGNDLIIWMNALLEDLTWGESGTRQFEAAMKSLGSFLGFGSQRPEEEAVDKGPDNLWALGNLKYLVIECKSGATAAQKISKHDTNQLNGSIVWFGTKYDASCVMVPIMVHQKTVFENGAFPDPNIRIVHEAGLTKLKKALSDYATALSISGRFKEASQIEKQLQHHRLDANHIVSLMTVAQGAR